MQKLVENKSQAMSIFPDTWQWSSLAKIGFKQKSSQSSYFVLPGVFFPPLSPQDERVPLDQNPYICNFLEPGVGSPGSSFSLKSPHLSL